MLPVLLCACVHVRAHVRASSSAEQTALDLGPCTNLYVLVLLCLPVAVFLLLHQLVRARPCVVSASRVGTTQAQHTCTNSATLRHSSHLCLRSRSRSRSSMAAGVRGGAGGRWHPVVGLAMWEVGGHAEVGEGGLLLHP